MTTLRSHAPAQASLPEPLARVGVDLVEVARFERILQDRPQFVSRVFTPAERMRCMHTAKPAEHFATRFAAREAVLKALGIGWAKGVGFQDVSVVENELGAPEIELKGAALETAQDLRMSQVVISLSHTNTLAVANAVVICKPAPSAQPRVWPRPKDERVSEATIQKKELDAAFKDARKIVLNLEQAMQEERAELKDILQSASNTQ